MERRIGDALVHYVEHGGGVPLVALHGAGVDHRDIGAAIEPVIPAELSATIRRSSARITGDLIT